MMGCCCEVSLMLTRIYNGRCVSIVGGGENDEVVSDIIVLTIESWCLEM